MRVFDFLNILTLLTFFTGTITLCDWLWRRWSRSSVDFAKKGFSGVCVEYARSFFPVFLIVVCIRAFIFQPYRVPTGSLEPTVMPGDFIFVTQFDYGLKIPLWDKVLIPVSHPKKGQIALFRWPVNPELTFVKRVLGIPGDRISYINKVFTVNGKRYTQQDAGMVQEIRAGGNSKTVHQYIENMDGFKHAIIVDPEIAPTNFRDLVVPAGMYFMVGDNRDDSDDSRAWGFVPQNYFIGRALLVWFNAQFNPIQFDWSRIGTKL